MAEKLSADPLAPPERVSKRHWPGEVLTPLIVAVVLALFVRTFVLQVFEIPSPSMEKGLQVGDQVLVNKFIYGPRVWTWEAALLPMRPPQRGDVVVFKLPTDPARIFIKRCVGLPGDKVEIESKRLEVNGEAPDETTYVSHTDPRIYPRALFLDDAYRKRDNFGPFFVPQAHYFFLGDNRDESNDSRFWGPVPRSYLKGRPVLILWSKNRRGIGLRSLRPVR
ncbi:MAG: signal peptidase I [Acidobacteria bacterium]|nr:signal peptidase I [Acidobacteriota bacterium]